MVPSTWIIIVRGVTVMRCNFTNNQCNEWKIKQFLGACGLDESIISQFCKAFESASEVRDEFLIYCSLILQHQEKEHVNDTVYHLDEDIIFKEMLNIGKFQSLIMKVHKNM